MRVTPTHPVPCPVSTTVDPGSLGGYGVAGGAPGGGGLRSDHTRYDDFARARPRRVSDGYARAHTTIAEYRGPAQREGTRLWFGKSFYDAEGHTGVGGFGVYDEATRRFEMFAPPEMADWSASAILVEPAAIWFGIGQCGEWGGTSGGLLRYDRATRSARRTETRGAVSGLARLGGELLAATSRGIAIFRGEAQQFYLLDRTTDGRIVVVSPE